MVEVMKIKVTSFKRSHACIATLSAPMPAACHNQCMPLLETPGHSLASLGQSLVGLLLLSPGSLCTTFCLCPPRACFPVLCKFWQLFGGVYCHIWLFILLRYIPSMPTFWRVFIINRWWISSKALSATIEVIIWFLSFLKTSGFQFVNMVYHIDLFANIEESFSSVAQLCPTLCNPMDHSMSGFSVHHQLPELVQIHVHQVGDAIQPSHDL